MRMRVDRSNDVRTAKVARYIEQQDGTEQRQVTRQPAEIPPGAGSTNARGSREEERRRNHEQLTASWQLKRSSASSTAGPVSLVALTTRLGGRHSLKCLQSLATLGSSPMTSAGLC